MPHCRGLGNIDLDVQYLPDITVTCQTCHGTRFNDATLAVRVNGLTIADVLGLSVRDALKQFAGEAAVAAGTPADVARDPGSVTGPWLAKHLSLPKARR